MRLAPAFEAGVFHYGGSVSGHECKTGEAERLRRVY